jgi:hypothetical protein
VPVVTKVGCGRFPLAEAAAAQSFERARLMSVGFELARRDLERVPTTRLRFEGSAGTDEWSFEHARVRVAEELVECCLHFGVGEGEGGPQVFGE